MKLQEKGPIKPVPVLAEPMEHVSKEIQNWKGIISATHWNLFDLEQVDGADFYVGEQELGHIHLDGSIHLATTKELQTELAKKFLYAQGWGELQP